MTSLIYIYAFATTFALAVSVKRNLDYYEKVESVVSQVEESLDILDECYAKIDAKTRIEVMSDDPVVRDLLVDITKSKDAILLIANKVYESTNDKETNEKA